MTGICGELNHRLFFYADGEKDDVVAAHIAECPDCAGEVAEMRRLIEATLAARYDEDPGEPFWDGLERDIRTACAAPAAPVRRRWRWLAGGAVAAAAVAALVVGLRHPSSPPAQPPRTELQRLDDEDLALGDLSAADDDIEDLDDDDVARAGANL